MSSYHVFNDLWFGLFPMLAASVLIGIICYIICCLNQIKNKIVLYRKRKRILKVRKKLEKRNANLKSNKHVNYHIKYGKGLKINLNRLN